MSVPAGATRQQPDDAPLPMLTDSSFFQWENLSLREDTIFVLAIAICLGVGIATGHPAAGMIAASGAMTVGLGAKQSIDDSRLLPMIFGALGISFSIFVGMVAGHAHFGLVLLTALWGFGYGLLSSQPAGYFWVGQQCVIYLVVGSAFPFSSRDAAVRAALMLAGGGVQILCASTLLHLLKQMGRNLLELARYIRTEELLLRSALAQTTSSLRHGRITNEVPYALRLALTLGVSTYIYTRLEFPSGYWIPMTALLVLKPGLSDTVNRAVARTLGTILGAVLASYWLAHIANPSPVVLALCTLVCIWLAYSTLNVNYALYSVFLTGYIVFLLSLDGISGKLIAERRAICTAIGGGLALAVRLMIIHHRLRPPRIDAP